MKKFRKVWTDEINEWLKTTKGMTPKDAYSLFLKTFNIADVTYTAFKNQRSRMGASGERVGKLQRPQRPLYAEMREKQKVYLRGTK